MPDTGNRCTVRRARHHPRDLTPNLTSRARSSRYSQIPEVRMSRRKPAPNDVGETARPWALSRTQWIWVALVLVATGLVFYSYELLNAAPAADLSLIHISEPTRLGMIS